jgi:hypothetical protein
VLQEIAHFWMGIQNYMTKTKKFNVGRKTLGSLTNPKLGIVQIIVMESELNLTL